jgi:competence protein ComEC
MPLPTAYFWSKAPFVRLIIALVSGIILQWQLQFSFEFLIATLCIILVFTITYFLIPVKWKYQFSYLGGVGLNIMIALFGGILVWMNDVRHNKNCIGNTYADSSYVVATIEEPLVEKTNSFKALATINGFYTGNKFNEADGKIILYFKKDTSLNKLHYGSQIIFNKPLQEIRNSGNPGGFDYKQYSLFQGITHQVNLSQKEFELVPTENNNWFRQLIFNCRHWVVITLQKFIQGEKEQGLAEALLIGYKDDLDKNLVQSYTNTGVVHIIAISGMHLGLIYLLLFWITKPIKDKKFQWLRAVLILSCLWLFTLLAGAQASVVRSAVMFTFIVFAKTIDRKTSIYNTLASSAFLLLCINPFWLWDVGFQLSYAAVVSIVTFYRPIYNWFYFPNKALDFLWKTMAISIAAQTLTTPIGLYHFHQFPIFFLLTNVFAVPISTVILFGEIAICAFAWLFPLAKFLGIITQFLIWSMNSYIERIETISFSLWNGFSITTTQALLLLIATTAICFWQMDKKKWMLWLSLCSFLLFAGLRSWSFTEAYQQKKLIVYNVPKYSAIDLVNGRTFNFLGDSALLYDDFIRNFHIQPSRILHRIEQNQILPVCCKDFYFCNKRIALIDSSKYFIPLQRKQPIDVLILSKNPRLYISNLLKTFDVRQIVIDGSVPQWKAKLWKNDCDSLRIPCFNVGEKGAFVMNL